MSHGIQDEWLVAFTQWARDKPSITKAWIFESRAKQTASLKSDLDIAILLEPNDGQGLAEWIFNCQIWENGIQTEIGSSPQVDQQSAWPQEDEIVWSAVVEHGILFYDKAS